MIFSFSRLILYTMRKCGKVHQFLLMFNKYATKVGQFLNDKFLDKPRKCVILVIC